MRLELKLIMDSDRDEFIQADEEQLLIVAQTRDNVKSGGYVDLDPDSGRVLVELSKLPQQQSRATLILTVNTGTSRLATALDVSYAEPAHRPWWRKFQNRLYPLESVRNPVFRSVCVSNLVTGRAERVLRTENGHFLHPRLSSDGRRIAVVVERGATRVIHLSNVDSKLEGTLQNLAAGSWPFWLPGDDGLIFVRQGTIWLHHFDPLKESALDFRADRILALRDLSGGRTEIIVSKTYFGVEELSLVELDGSHSKIRGIRRLQFYPDWERRLKVGPSHDKMISGTASGGIAVVDRDGKEIAVVESGSQPSWSPTGEAIIYLCPGS